MVHFHPIRSTPLWEVSEGCHSQGKPDQPHVEFSQIGAFTDGIGPTEGQRDIQIFLIGNGDEVSFVVLKSKFEAMPVGGMGNALIPTTADAAVRTTSTERLER